MTSEKAKMPFVQKYFEPGCDMWVLVNNPDSTWWRNINFSSSFLLSRLSEKTKSSFTNSISPEVQSILNETGLPVFNFKNNSNIVYVGVENHFHTKWICLFKNKDELSSEQFIQNLKTLKCNNLRLFFDTEVPASLKASFPDLQIVSDSH